MQPFLNPEDVAKTIDERNMVVYSLGWAGSPTSTYSIYIDYINGDITYITPNPDYKGPFCHDIFPHLQNKNLWPDMKREYESGQLEPEYHR